MAAAGAYVPGKDMVVADSDQNQPGRFFSSFPTSTPKFARNIGPRRSEFIETMARLIISVPEGLQQLKDTLPGDVRSAASTLLTASDITHGTRNGSGAGYFDFLLSSVSQQHQEREQCVDTLTDNTVVFYSGQSAPMLSCNGYFFNTFQDDQNVWFQLLYAELLRGTMLARRNLTVSLRYDSFFMTGYLTGLQVNTEGGAKNYVQFAFTFRVKQVQITTPILYNPSSGRSLMEDNLFTQDSPRNSDDTTRVGVETAETPAAPSAVPATAAAVTDTDAREILRTNGIPDQTIQAMVDAELAAQDTAAAAQLPTDPAAAQAFDTAATPTTQGSGDVRGNLPARDAQRIQDYSTASTPLNRQQEDALATEVMRALETNGRGTVVISPVTNTAESSSVYANSIARQVPAQTYAAAVNRQPVSNPGAGSAGPPLTAASAPLQDVYRPPGRLIAQVAAAVRNRGDNRLAQGAMEALGELATLRTRQRATG